MKFAIVSLAITVTLITSAMAARRAAADISSHTAKIEKILADVN